MVCISEIQDEAADKWVGGRGVGRREVGGRMTRPTRNKKFDLSLGSRRNVVHPSPRNPEIGDRACTGTTRRREFDLSPRNPEIGEITCTRAIRRRKEVDPSLEGLRETPAWAVSHLPEIRKIAGTQATLRREEADPSQEGYRASPPWTVSHHPTKGDLEYIGPTRGREANFYLERHRASPLWTVSHHPEIGDMAYIGGSRKREANLSLEAYGGSPAWVESHHPEIRDVASTRVVDCPTQLTSAKDLAGQSASTRGTQSRVRLGEFNPSMLPNPELLENARKRLNDLSDVYI